MVTDRQVLILFDLVTKRDIALVTAAAKAGMSENTARRYIRSGKLPSELKSPRRHRTREDAFAAVWSEVLRYLEDNPGLEVKALFAELQRRYPGQFKPGQLRTLQRRVKQWRATSGPPGDGTSP